MMRPYTCHGADTATMHRVCLSSRACAGADDYCRAKGVRAIDAEPVAMKPEVVYIKQYDSQAVKDAVATKGPLSIGIDASCIPFRFYSSGVLSTSECGTDPDSIDHAVLLVGYGEEDGMAHACRATFAAYMARRLRAA